ncbi:MAG: orotate phosphoribosyltransferase [Syntrophobacterales bacterium]|jgi:orotate phosphoribosyltransferase|nr:orotate phosphoribosyltransferase [Syntrophobacterales bacterium]
MDQARRQLLKLLKEKSFRYSPEKPFTLVSGRVSPYYVDCRPTTHNAQGLALIGKICFELIRDLQVDAIGGLTMGADPIAHAVALTSYLQGRPINAFSVRQQPKAHGTGGLLVGDVRPGNRVVVVEDVVTTGGSTLRAVAAARDFGLEVVKVLILVDRQEGGKEAVAEKVPDVEAVFTISDLR